MIGQRELCSPEAVLEASRSVFTNKYAEGYPGGVTTAVGVRRCGGKSGARSRAKQLFVAGARQRAAALRLAGQRRAYMAVFASRATHSGSDLAHGGHLTHGQQVEFQAASFYKPTFYTVRRDTEMIDYDELETHWASAKSQGHHGRRQRGIQECGTSRACVRSPTRA